MPRTVRPRPPDSSSGPAVARARQTGSTPRALAAGRPRVGPARRTLAGRPSRRRPGARQGRSGLRIERPVRNGSPRRRQDGRLQERPARKQQAKSLRNERPPSAAETRRHRGSPAAGGGCARHR
eukprot:scaffold2077_cov66-Phaeocystis_antarctica.AAC.2